MHSEHNFAYLDLQTHQLALSGDVGEDEDVLGVEEVGVEDTSTGDAFSEEDTSTGDAFLEEDTSTGDAIGVEEPSTEDALGAEEVDLEMQVQSTRY